jgi:uncharacterized protein (DUF1800 family)
LYRRAGFAGAWPQLQQAIRDGPIVSIDRLLAAGTEAADFDAQMDRYERSAARGNSTDSLRAWWLRRMIETPDPLREKMALFWHGHFAISNAGVNSGTLMARHVQNLRKGAFGSYQDLLATVIEDPALYLWLRCQRSRKAEPAPYVARQLLDQYGVGPGNYSETDVRETARALTGRSVLRNELRFFEREFDPGEKTILGQTGPWNAADAIRIVREHRATSENVVRRLYASLIAEDTTPDPALIDPLVRQFHQDDDILSLVSTMLRSKLFFSETAYRQRIKSPVELAVGMARQFEAMVPTAVLGQHLADLGQDLYRPPTATGWSGGRDWINSATLDGRHRLTRAMVSASGPYEGRIEPRSLLEKLGAQERSAAAEMLGDLMLQDVVQAAELDGWLQESDGSGEAGSAELRKLVTLLTLLPEYQLS